MVHQHLHVIVALRLLEPCHKPHPCRGLNKVNSLRWEESCMLRCGVRTGQSWGTRERAGLQGSLRVPLRCLGQCPSACEQLEAKAAGLSGLHNHRGVCSCVIQFGGQFNCQN